MDTNGHDQRGRPIDTKRRRSFSYRTTEENDLPGELLQTPTRARADEQGLWWGGERFWLEDMVRINKHRSGLPLDQFPMDGRTPQDGCVFLKIRSVPYFMI